MFNRPPTHEIPDRPGDGFSVSWFPVKGRKSLDRKAAEKAGIDFSPYEREGDPSERLTITMN